MSRKRHPHRIPRHLRPLLMVLVLAGCAGPQQVEEEPPAQAKLATEVKVALVEDDSLDAAAIFVDADGSVVRLSGFTDSAAERERAVRLARGVAGVERVEDSIQVR